MLEIHPKILQDELIDAGLPVRTIKTFEDDTYKIVYWNELTQNEKDIEAQVLADHDPVDYVELRRQNARMIFQQSAMAKMTKDEMHAWIDANITDPKTNQALKEVATMIVGLRNDTMADIMGQQPD